MNGGNLDKPMSLLTAADIKEVCRLQLPEGADLEFKRTLPDNGKTPDPWIRGENSIGDAAKEKIAAEVIAFANAHGGTVIVGVDETDEKPARAKIINPIPRCHELAERLRSSLSSLIEPKLSIIEVEGIATDENGAGVVVLRTGASRLAPHRYVRSKECYTRRADRTEPMSMREIQDLTLFVDRGLRDIQTRIAESEARLEARADGLLSGYGASYVIRITVMPLGPTGIPRVHSRPDALPGMWPFNVDYGKGPVEVTGMTRPIGRWRPFLGGTSTRLEDTNRRMDIEVQNSGLTEYVFFVGKKESPYDLLPLRWFVGLMANALASAHKFRIAAKMPNVEIAVSAGLHVGRNSVRIPRLSDAEGIDSIGAVGRGKLQFPRYGLVNPEDALTIVNEMVRDLGNAAGEDFDSRFSVDFETRFHALGLA